MCKSSSEFQCYCYIYVLAFKDHYYSQAFGNGRIQVFSISIGYELLKFVMGLSLRLCYNQNLVVERKFKNIVTVMLRFG